MQPTKATYKDVGFIAIPADNSHSMNLATFQNEMMAGKQVKIMSRPFKLPVMASTFRVIWREFVLISYDDNIIRVINNFSAITNHKT